MEIKTSDGKYLVKFYVYVKKAGAEGKHAASTGEREEKKQAESAPANDNLMTPAQKRYLLHILADQGIEGDKADQKLLDIFQAESLLEITKVEASHQIELLLEEPKEVHDGTPS